MIGKKAYTIGSAVVLGSTGLYVYNQKNDFQQIALMKAADANTINANPNIIKKKNNKIIQTEKQICGLVQYPANNPNEDRYRVAQLDFGGHWFSVFDGHGGWQCAEFVQNHLHENLSIEISNRLGIDLSSKSINRRSRDFSNQSIFQSPADEQSNNELNNNNDGNSFDGPLKERLIRDCLVQAFERTDRIYTTKVYSAFEVGFGRGTRAGSCALAVLVVDGYLFVANAGDCRAVLGVNRLQYNKLDAESKNQGKPDGKAYENDDEDDVEKELFHDNVDAILRKAAVSQAQGIKIDKATEDALNKTLIREATRVKEKSLIEQIIEEEEQDAAAENSLKKPQKNNSTSTLGSVVRFLTGGSSSNKNMSSAGSNKKKDSKTVDTDDLDEDDDETKYRDDASKKYIGIQLSHDHNCREPRERRKLELEHPDEDDVVSCKPDKPDVCYIKGKLQPSRSFGDYLLKYGEFMRTSEQPSAAGKYISTTYTPPYIIVTPEISSVKLRKGVDSFIVLATDGLWDFLDNQQVTDICSKILREQKGTPEQCSQALRDAALTEAGRRIDLTLREVKSLPLGRTRRKRHDDITVIVVDLEELINQEFYG